MSRWVITTCLPARALRLLLFRANATICGSMSPTDTGQSGARIPRVGIPWRTSAEEEEATISGKRGKTQDYINAVARAGAESVLVPLQDEQARNRLIPTLDGFVLPGSPADVEPRRYGSLNRGLSAPPDSAREETDRAILRHAFAVKKPVLAICYGCQLLNVYLGGTLIQDLRAETSTATPHRKKDLVPEPQDDPTHPATLQSGSRLSTLAGGTRAVINSSHHQAIREPGKNLHVTSRASDGTIEGVEWTGDSNWVTGVQWHPERMLGDAFSERLFRAFVAAAANTREVVAHKT
jgi:putative glutamine amidotransferase